MNDQIRTLPVPLSSTPATPMRTSAGKRTSIFITALASVIAAFAFGWYSFGFETVLPFVFLLPCAAMMVMCMRGMGQQNGSR